MRRTLLLLVMLVSIVLLSSITVLADNGVLYYVYGMHTCPHCHRMVEFLKENHYNYYFCDLASSKTCAEYFMKFINVMKLPEAVPITVVIKNKTILAIVIGEAENKTFLDHLASLKPSLKIPVYYSTQYAGYLQVTNMTAMHEIVENLIYLPNNITTVNPISNRTAQNNNTNTQHPRIGSPAEVLGYLIPLALTDSINPCTFVIYATLLSAIAVISRRKMVLAGLLFILGVVAGYGALGLAILYGLSMVNVPQWVPALILVGYGGAVVLLSMGKKNRECKICKEEGCGRLARIRQKIESLKAKSLATPVFALILGLVLSVTLLPCSAGPYFAFLSTLALSKTPGAPLYIAVYNVFFSIPLLAILGALVLGKNICPKIDKYSRHIRIVAGIILFIMGMYLLFLS